MRGAAHRARAEAAAAQLARRLRALPSQGRGGGRARLRRLRLVLVRDLAAREQLLLLLLLAVLLLCCGGAAASGAASCPVGIGSLVSGASGRYHGPYSPCSGVLHTRSPPASRASSGSSLPRCLGHGDACCTSSFTSSSAKSEPRASRPPRPRTQSIKGARQRLPHPPPNADGVAVVLHVEGEQRRLEDGGVALHRVADRVTDGKALGDLGSLEGGVEDGGGALRRSDERAAARAWPVALTTAVRKAPGYERIVCRSPGLRL